MLNENDDVQTQGAPVGSVSPEDAALRTRLEYVAKNGLRDESMKASNALSWLDGNSISSLEQKDRERFLGEADDLYIGTKERLDDFTKDERKARFEAREKASNDIRAKMQFVVDENGDDKALAEETQKAKNALGYLNTYSLDGLTDAQLRELNAGADEIYGAAERRRGHFGVFVDSLKRGNNSLAVMVKNGLTMLKPGELTQDDMDGMRTLKTAGEQYDLAHPKRVNGIKEIGSAGDVVDFVAESVGENLERTALAMAGSMLGAPLGAAGAVAGASAAGMAMNTGEAVQDQLDENVAEFSRGLALAQGALYGAAEGAFGVAPGLGRMYGKILRSMGKEAAKKTLATGLRETGQAAVVKNAAKEYGKMLLGEAAQEPLQSQVVGRGRRWIQTGTPFREGETGTDAWWETADEAAGAFAAALVTGGIGAGGNVAGARRKVNIVRNVVSHMKKDERFDRLSPEYQMLIGRHAMNDALLATNRHAPVMTDEDRALVELQNADIERSLADDRGKEGDVARAVLADMTTNFALEDRATIVEKARTDGTLHRHTNEEIADIRATEQEIEPLDGKKVTAYYDRATRQHLYRIQDGMGEGKDAWLTVPPQGMKPSLDGAEAYSDLNDALDALSENDAYNKARAKDSEAKRQVISDMVKNMYKGEVNLVLADGVGGIRDGRLRGIMAANPSSAMYDPDTNTLVVLTDKVSSIGEMYTAVAHEGLHKEIADYVKANGETLSEGRKRLFKDGVYSGDYEKAYGRSDEGEEAGEEAVVERASVERIVQALNAQDRTLVGAGVRRVIDGVKQMIGADTGLAGNVITDDDVRRELNFLWNRGDFGVKAEVRVAGNDNEADILRGKREDAVASEANAVRERAAEAERQKRQRAVDAANLNAETFAESYPKSYDAFLKANKLKDGAEAKGKFLEKFAADGHSVLEADTAAVEPSKAVDAKALEAVEADFAANGYAEVPAEVADAFAKRHPELVRNAQDGETVLFHHPLPENAPKTGGNGPSGAPSETAATAQTEAAKPVEGGKPPKSATSRYGNERQTAFYEDFKAKLPEGTEILSAKKDANGTLVIRTRDADGKAVDTFVSKDGVSFTEAPKAVNREGKVLTGTAAQHQKSHKSPCVLFRYKSDGADSVGHLLYGDIDAIVRWAAENGMNVVAESGDKGGVSAKATAKESPAVAEKPPMSAKEANKALGMDAALNDRQLAQRMKAWEAHAKERPEFAKKLEAAKVVLEYRKAKGKADPHATEVEARPKADKAVVNGEKSAKDGGEAQKSAGVVSEKDGGEAKGDRKIGEAYKVSSDRIKASDEPFDYHRNGAAYAERQPVSIDGKDVAYVEHYVDGRLRELVGESSDVNEYVLFVNGGEIGSHRKIEKIVGVRPQYGEGGGSVLTFKTEKDLLDAYDKLNDISPKAFDTKAEWKDSPETESGVDPSEVKREFYDATRIEGKGKTSYDIDKGMDIVRKLNDSELDDIGWYFRMGEKADGEKSPFRQAYERVLKERSAPKPVGNGRMANAEAAQRPSEETGEVKLGGPTEPTDAGFAAWAVGRDGKPLSFASEAEREQSRKVFDTLVRRGVVDGSTGASAVRFRREENAEYRAVEAKYRGTDGWMKAPNGKPTNLTERQWVQVRTPSFKAWFGDWENDPENASKVVDENGEPKVVYHGSADFTPDAGFHVFGTGGRNESYGAGAFFASNKSVADQYANDGAPYEVFLNIRNPKTHDWNMTLWSEATDDEAVQKAEQEYIDRTGDVDLADFEPNYADFRMTTDDFSRKARSDGHDGAFMYRVMDEVQGGNTANESDIYTVFDPAQVKSATDNTGAFDGRNADIRFRRSDGEKYPTASADDPNVAFGSKEGIKDKTGYERIFARIANKDVMDEGAELARDYSHVNGVIGKVERGDAPSSLDLATLIHAYADKLSELDGMRNSMDAQNGKARAGEEEALDVAAERVFEGLRLAGSRSGHALQMLKVGIALKGVKDTYYYLASEVKALKAKQGLDPELTDAERTMLEAQAKELKAANDKLKAALDAQDGRVAELEEMNRTLAEFRDTAKRRISDAVMRKYDIGDAVAVNIGIDGLSKFFRRASGARLARTDGSAEAVSLNDEIREAFASVLYGAKMDGENARAMVSDTFGSEAASLFDGYLAEIGADRGRDERVRVASGRAKEKADNRLAKRKQRLDRKRNDTIRALYAAGDDVDARRKAVAKYLRDYMKYLAAVDSSLSNEDILKRMAEEANAVDPRGNYTSDDMLDAVGGKGGYDMQTREETEKRLALVKRALALAQAGKKREAADLLGVPYDGAVDELEKTERRLKKMLERKEYAKMDLLENPPPDLAEKEAEVARLEAEVKETADLIRTMRTEIAQAEKKAKVIAALQQQLDARQKELAELGDGVSPERKERAEREIDGLKRDLSSVRSETNLARRIADENAELERRIRENDFEPPARKPRAVERSPEVQMLMERRDRLRKRLAAARKAYQYKKQNAAKQLWDDFWAILGESKAIAGSLDLSSMFRQGGQLTFAHPLLFARNFRRALAALRSEENADSIMREIMGRPNAKYYAKAGVDFTDWGEGASSADDRFAIYDAKTGEGRWLLDKYHKVVKQRFVKAGVNMSERAFAVYLNLMRADVFDYLVAHSTYGDAGRMNASQLKALGNFVNVASQRGMIEKGGNLGKAINFLNYILWSPRNVISRFQFLWETAKLVNPLANPYGDRTLRKLFAAELARYLGGMAAMIAFAKFMADLLKDGDEPPDDIELDPRSSQFLRVKFGNTRVDFMSGLAQVVTFLGRWVTGRNKNSRGQLRDTNFAESLGKLIRTKLSPAAAFAWDFSSGETFSRQDIVYDRAWTDTKDEKSAYRHFAETFVPLTFSDLAEQAAYSGVGNTALTFMFTLLGAGVNAYDPLTYKQMTGDFHYYKRLYAEADDDGRKRLILYHPMLKRAGSIELAVRDVNRLKASINKRKKANLEVHQELQDALERRQKLVINLIGGAPNPSQVD